MRSEGFVVRSIVLNGRAIVEKIRHRNASFAMEQLMDSRLELDFEDLTFDSKAVELRHVDIAVGQSGNDVSLVC